MGLGKWSRRSLAPHKVCSIAGVVLIAWATSQAAASHAAALQVIGVLGNSGEAGPTLVRAGSLPFDRCATGVAADADFTLWHSGGDRINRLSLDGRLIDSFPIEPTGSIADSKNFALLHGTLYFLGWLPDGNRAIFALPTRHEPHQRLSARPLPTDLPKERRPWIPPILAGHPLGDELVLVTEPQDLAEGLLGVYLISPNPDGSIRLAFTVEGLYPAGADADSSRRVIYVGASLRLPGQDQPTDYALGAFRPDGTLLDGFPVACTKTPAIPTQFRGVVSLAGGALWETAWYGFLSRLDLAGAGAPGRIVEWHHELGYPTQVIDVAESAGTNLPPAPERPQLLAITTAMPDALYLAHWHPSTQRLDFIRRVGALPTIASLGLSHTGWATVGTARCQLWWRWEDAADAPPRKAELHIAVTPVYFRDDRFLSLAAQYRLDDLEQRNPVPTIFSHRVGDRNEAQRVGEPVPMKGVIGLGVYEPPGQSSGKIFVADAEGKIWRAPIWLPDLRPDFAAAEVVQILPDGLRKPTDITALTDGRLLIADQDRVVLLEPEGDAYRAAASFSAWGQEPQEHFGPRLRMAVDGPWMLVADTDRHRVVWLDWTEWRFLAQFGHTDEAGDDQAHLNAPTLVALAGTRALVADSGNQRVLKLTLQP